MIAEHEHEIDAPPELVWEVITDWDRYPEWNPFVVSCSSTLEVGAPIDMRVRVLPWFAQRQREWITEHEPGLRFCYSMAGMPEALLASARCHTLTALEGGRTHYASRFELRGLLAPFVGWMLGGRLASGFGAMSAAIRTRAEALHRTPSRPPSGFAAR